MWVTSTEERDCLESIDHTDNRTKQSHKWGYGGQDLDDVEPTLKTRDLFKDSFVKLESHRFDVFRLSSFIGKHDAAKRVALGRTLLAHLAFHGRSGTAQRDPFEDAED